ncbi:uncharacterized protein LOC112453236 [Temnothorax curvispinosus]|uniref:Uncharacterized protein LOC112453236 n=1 Tax=Temnothorax curvispinosus TaxID=300111 RepID=A0A6J1PJ50_9HYME|nr:uncharacterized protein LOC112453236 [Temnothorax curvispinosus]
MASPVCTGTPSQAQSQSRCDGSTNELLLRLTEQLSASSVNLNEQLRESNSRFSAFVEEQRRTNSELMDKLDKLSCIASNVESNTNRIVELEQQCAALRSEIRELRGDHGRLPVPPTQSENELIISGLPGVLSIAPSVCVRNVFAALDIPDLTCHVLDVRAVKHANDVDVNDVAANDVDANDDVNVNENIGGAGVHHIVDINNIPVVIEGNNETLDSVLRNVIEIKELCRRIDERLNTMENRNNVNVNHNNIDMLPQLPMNNIEEIDNFEIILASAEAQSQLINMLVMIGGTTTKDAMKRALQKLFTNNLASKCSWTGAKNNFKLKELKIIICMKASIKKTCPSITEAEFEDILKTWFRQANLRLLRENARKNVINNT